ncbi:asparagine synthase (glutamine-hydrolyzing) [Synechococcus sp. UW140]|uniref:asparagine synthase (glutamine-hydrolyzing) n=1 Tax=Synechococcus sp. UW140 TaxID=368503 RepID=UPI003137B05E
MCGIAGLWYFGGGRSSELEHQARSMASAIVRRGPDDAGVWCDPVAGLALAHQRLAILDLSPSGHQPMASASGRFVIAFNGEIYNHLALRRDLEADGQLCQPWHGHSDTETLLVAIEAWGLEESLRRCTGMFAIALWDRRECQLQLARDRFGEKPLYYGISGSGPQRALLFGSELAALRSWPGFNNSISRPALTHLLRFTAIAAPCSIYAGIQQLLPGHLLTLQHPLPSDLPDPQPWWCFRSMLAEAIHQPFACEAEGLSALEAELTKAVQEQSLADVPLGSFLSGGIDSSLITALLQAQSSRPVRTFTIGFEETGFNEAPYARAVAAHLGTDHCETIVTANDARELIPQLPRLYSEPFADSSQLPTHLVCREARRSGLTVALSGDGGDELFGGYNRYFWGPRIWNRLAWLPLPSRRLLGKAICSLPPRGWDLLGLSLPINQLGHKAHKLADRLSYVSSSDDLYSSLVSDWLDPLSVLQPDFAGNLLVEPSSPLDWNLPAVLADDPVARMMARDTVNYLSNDILTKVDRAAMAVSLETRAPFLNHNVAEIAWRLPMAMKIRGGQGKWVLRQILYKHVPRHLIERPKAGFGMPIGTWLRGPLRTWANELLSPSLMQRQGYLLPEPIQRLWQQHLTGRYDHTSKIWTVLMWQAWLAEWG